MDSHENARTTRPGQIIPSSVLLNWPLFAGLGTMSFVYNFSLAGTRPDRRHWHRGMKGAVSRHHD